jgi:hypothetical protein
MGTALARHGMYELALNYLISFACSVKLPFCGMICVSYIATVKVLANVSYGAPDLCVVYCYREYAVECIVGCSHTQADLS